MKHWAMVTTRRAGSGTLLAMVFATALAVDVMAADAPLQATEAYRSRVHTAGHYCCPGGAAYCNVSDTMRQDRCSGYYDFGSPQLLLTPVIARRPLVSLLGLLGQRRHEREQREARQQPSRTCFRHRV